MTWQVIPGFLSEGIETCNIQPLENETDFMVGGRVCMNDDMNGAV